MKRYIKSSFGLEDKDWIEPEEEGTEDVDCVYFTVFGRVRTDDAAEFTEQSLDDLYYSNSSIDREGCAYMSYGVDVVADNGDVINDVIDAMRSKYYGSLDADTWYSVEAKCHADYSFVIERDGSVNPDSVQAEGTYVDSVSLEVEA